MNSRCFKWVDGVPLATSGIQFGKEQLLSALQAGAASPYEPRKDSDGQILIDEYKYQRPDGSWMLNGEVGPLKLNDAFAHGDREAGKELMDRLMGKPMQQTQSITMNVSYSEFLNGLAELDKHSAVEVEYSPVDDAIAALWAGTEEILAPTTINTKVEVTDDLSWL